MNVIEAAYKGTEKGVKSLNKTSKVELNLIKRAENAGYAGVAKPTGVGYKVFGCGKCRRNTAYKFVHIIKARAFLACHCGWRKEVNV